ncbi:MAG TPA: galactokinase [Mucilaginibacter sp.]|jgi:galactokinase|nr:galactokinase [Mucilaginibacter sp.]
MKNHLHKEFNKLFNKNAENAYFSPGRVNLIGEHIDYNGGLVMPCAITFGTYLLVSPNNDGIFRFRSLNFEDKPDIPLQNDYIKTDEKWFNYPLGVIEHILKDGHVLGGLDMLFYGDIPIGSGLSSSASIEVVTAFALNDLFDSGYSKLDLVKLSKSVENNFIGVNCGIMDQFAVAFGEKSKALMLNCDTLDYQAVDSNLGEYILAIINTNKPRKLAESKYNERVQECQAALTALKQELDINNLCDIDTATFNKHSHLITDKVIYKRAQHVIEENDRVKLAAVALSNNNLAEFGRLMYASHDSLRDLYEVSGKELDAVVEYSKTDADVAGARMTGAGFGGCAIALVKESAFEDFSQNVIAYYTSKIGYAPSVYSSLIGNGVGELEQSVMRG